MIGMGSQPARRGPDPLRATTEHGLLHAGARTIDMDDLIYERPRDYDLEHEDDEGDVAFHLELARRLATKRVRELGAGSGRVTVALSGLGVKVGFSVTGLDRSASMSCEAERKLLAEPPAAREAVALASGHMRTSEAPAPFDRILVPHAGRGRSSWSGAGQKRRMYALHAVCRTALANRAE
jgi:SAM-dependent methyltransferase